MADLKLRTLPDRIPVKLAISISPELKCALEVLSHFRDAGERP